MSRGHEATVEANSTPIDRGSNGAPRDAYDDRLAARTETLSRVAQRSLRISLARGAVFLVAAVIAIAALATDAVSWSWLALPMVAFVTLVVLHEVTIRAERRAQQAVDHYRFALDRLDHRWVGRGVQSLDYVAIDHPCAADLDLFGEGSLFELLCTARTRFGEEALARYLTARVERDEIEARQAAVQELRGRLDLREELALLADGVRAALRPAVLLEWARAPSGLSPGAGPGLRALAWLLTIAALSSAVLWALGWVGPIPLLVVALLEWPASRLFKRWLGEVIDPVDRAARELEVLVALLTRLEREPFAAPRSKALKERLRADGSSGVQAIRRLRRLVGWLESRQNQFFAPFAYLLMWSAHFGLAIEGWRQRCGPSISRWLEALGEFEALCALSGYAYEHPDDPFPEILDGAACLEAQALGHPLLAPDKCVRNDVTMGEGARVYLVSGSNMAGKSTLLRAVGVNTTLAMAGAPVRAVSLRLTPLSIGATIQVQDSLLAGASRFYAEISRFKQIMDLAGAQPPLLFLFDEVLHGTNSHDRRIGAVAIVKQLLDAGAIGLVTTHDLAIADAASDMHGSLRNVHFADQVTDGELSFDYTLRPGPVPRGNALLWMRAVGLEV